MMTDAIQITREDYSLPEGSFAGDQAEGKARLYCEMLESGRILTLPELPFDLSPEDREFLLAQQWAEARLHKNVSYRPDDDILKGVSGDPAKVDRLHSIMRSYSSRMLEFLGRFLSPYASQWILDFASFRPLEELGRNLPLHKRNDLLHVDAFPSRPTRGGRILRIFTNLHPSRPRVWEITGPFTALAEQYARAAGLDEVSRKDSFVGQVTQKLGRKLGIREADRSPYDRFMLRFHDYLKENATFQAGCEKTRLEFAPLATWMVYTDGVAHAAMSGQFALEQTLIIPPSALLAPQLAPYRILEKIAGRPLIS
jgi:hypothetical protein